MLVHVGGNKYILGIFDSSVCIAIQVKDAYLKEQYEHLMIHILEGP